MAITTLNGVIAATSQEIAWLRTGARTTVAANWFSLFDVAGEPGLGTLAGTSTAAGVVPTDATAGCPPITAFGGGATGYLSIVDFGSTVACRMRCYDLLWKGGAYAFNASQALTGQPSYSSRIPGGEYTGTELWVEQVTTGTGTQSVAVTYMDQNGNTGATTGTVAAPAVGSVGRMWKLPFASGDSGIQKVENVVGSVASGGTFNILVLRRLWSGRVRAANDGDVHGIDKTGMPIVYADSALYPIVATDSTASGVPEIYFNIING